MSIALWLALSGAEAWAKPKVYTAVRVDLEGRTGLCPGEFQKLDVFATTGGKEVRLKFGQWKAFDIAWSIGPVSPKGGLEMPLDPVPLWSNVGALTVTSVDDPAVKAEVNLPMRYDCSIVLDRSGADGAAGASGERGSSGADQDGGDGQDGQGGRPGGGGHDLDVKVARVTEPVRGVEVLQVMVTDLTAGGSWGAAVAVSGGKLVISTRGGAGGPGGAGGDGGSGSTDRNGGHGAEGGEGGDGGPGGRITVHVDPSAEGHLGALVFENGGGAAGAGGPGGAGGQAFDPGTPGRSGHAGHDGRPGVKGPPPEIVVEPLGALW